MLKCITSGFSVKESITVYSICTTTVAVDETDVRSTGNRRARNVCTTGSSERPPRLRRGGPLAHSARRR